MRRGYGVEIWARAIQARATAQTRIAVHTLVYENWFAMVPFL